MTERHDTVVIGGGQAGLATGYYLQQHDQDFVILDAGDRVGDAWRARWDSLRVFTPARYSSLPGMDYPGSPYAFPTKDEVADYLETYAQRFDLPVELGVRVDGLERSGDGFLVSADDRRFETDSVVVAMASYQVPKVPEFASELSDDIVQLHTSDYRNPDQLQDGGVLVVGAGNSGAEIAYDNNTLRIITELPGDASQAQLSLRIEAAGYAIRTEQFTARRGANPIWRIEMEESRTPLLMQRLGQSFSC